MTSWEEMQGKWEQVRGLVKEQWGEFTDDDLDKIDGRRDQFVGKMRERYGVAKEEAEQRADELLSSLS